MSKNHAKRSVPVEVLIGAFASAVFFAVGVFGTVANLSTITLLNSARSWPVVEAEITASHLVHIDRQRGSRPEYTLSYTWSGQSYASTGYSLTDVYSSDTTGLRAVLNQHPPGSRIRAFVNPARPTQVVVTRGEAPALILIAAPLLFALLGLIGALFTIAGWLGWLDAGSKHPVGRAVRAFGSVFLRGNVLMTIFFVIVGGIVVGLGVWSYRSRNPLPIVLALVMVWGVWNAARPRK